VWDALAAGAIPVYAGAPDIAEHLPHAQAAVLVDLHTPAAEVAAALDAAEADPARYLGWRVRGHAEVSPPFAARVAALEHGPDTPPRPESLCGQCERLWRTRHHLPLPSPIATDDSEDNNDSDVEGSDQGTMIV
jgi:hypothetical protein